MENTANAPDRNDLIPMLVQIAQLYYQENLSQQEIADRLNMSRSLIALYLKKAREQGIVRIEIVDPRNNLENLSMRLRERYGLKYAAVVSTVSGSDLLTRRALGQAMASYLDQNLRDGDVLGLGWGRTILEMVGTLSLARSRRIEVVPLLGESGYTGSYTQLNQGVMQTARTFGGMPYFLLAPVLVGSQELRDDLMLDASIHQVAQRWKRLSIACVGIGTVPPVEGQVVYLGEENIPDLVKQGAVGDICARYYNRSGQFLETKFNECLIGVSMEDLRQAGAVAAIAGGTDKAVSVSGALHTGLISALFVDESLARILVEESWN